MAPPRQLDATFAVYGLSTDGRSHRYVGFTGRNGLRARMASHRFRARHDDQPPPVYAWMREVGPENVVAVVLEKVNGEPSSAELAVREIAWIAKLRSEGFDLLNRSNGGIGTNGLPGPRWPRQAGDPVVHQRTGKKRGPYNWTNLSKQAQSGGRAAHNRWHAARGIVSNDCTHCVLGK